MDVPSPHMAGGDAYSLPLDQIDVSDPKLYQDDIWPPFFERLRREDPVHYTRDGMYGSFWSVTKYKDIMQVEVNHQIYSSDALLGGITITDRPMEFLGNITLLIVGGNDTTRNSISGGLWALSENPQEYQKLRDNQALIPSMVSEIIRWQTPIVHMRRTALADAELGGKQIKKGDKVVMWYISANRDEDAIENPNQFIIDRARPRQHISFGFGIHRCVGNRLAELQLTIMWEEIMKRFPVIEVLEQPKRIYSNFIHGISELMVRIPA